ncbi:MAG: HD domain-containing protein [Syntrophaceae bacterium]|nr:HD domain-containing protein [Syntrophaceae bacterium]
MTILEGLSLSQSELETIPVFGSRAIEQPSRQLTGVPIDKRLLHVEVVDNHSADYIMRGMQGRMLPAMRSHLAAGRAILHVSADQGRQIIRMITTANSALSPNAMLVGEVNPAYLWTLAKSTLPGNVDISVLDSSGSILFASRSLSPQLLSAVRIGLNKSSVGQLEWKGDGQEYFVSYWTAFLKPAFLIDSWTVIAVQSQPEYLGPIHSFAATFRLVVLLTLLIVVFVSSLLIRRSLVPLLILKDGAQRLSAGDFSSKVEISSGDEFEELSDSFNNMSEQLGTMFTRLGETGMLVQMVLESNDRDTIVNAIMTRFRKSVPCEWLAIATVDDSISGNYLICYNKGTDAAPGEILLFEAHLSEEEIEILGKVSDNLPVTAGDGFSSLLAPMASEGCSNFFLLPISIKERFFGLLILGYGGAKERITEELAHARRVANEIAISMDKARLINELNILNQGTIEALANAVDAKSPWTAGHSDRVTRLSLLIGKEMGLSKAELDLLRLGGRFHDMGKIGVPEVILDKPGKLTEEEYAIIKQHPQKGADILKPVHAYREAIPIVAQHHERYDGLGYPLGLAGEEIALGARILAVADVFDALHSHRPYRSSWQIERVLDYLREESGTFFDPDVVNTFLRIDRSAYADLSYENTVSKRREE